MNENGAFTEHYIEDDAYAVKILFDLREQNSTNFTQTSSPPTASPINNELYQTVWRFTCITTSM